MDKLKKNLDTSVAEGLNESSLGPENGTRSYYIKADPKSDIASLKF